MSRATDRDDSAMRYLLGDLSEDEKTRMEESFFADDSRFEALQFAEEELIDAFVRKRLSAEDERKFQARLQQSPRLVDRVKFARALAERADSTPLPEATDIDEPAPAFAVQPSPVPKRRWWESFFQPQPAVSAALAAACLLLFIGGPALLYGWLRLRSESHQLAAERSSIQAQREELNKLTAENQTRAEQLDAEKRALELAQNEQKSRESESTESGESLLRPIVSLILRPGSLRSGGSANELIVGSKTSAAELKLLLAQSDYSNYQVTVRNVDDGKVASVRNLKAQNTQSGQQLIFQIPARRLPPGDYSASVSGRASSGDLEPVEGYAFRVRRP